MKTTEDQNGASLKRVVGRQNLVELVGEAMQDVWNDHVGDCGTVPDCFELAGRNPKLTCAFTGSQFAFSVARRLEWLAANPPKADWYISLKNAQGRWMQVMTVSDRTREEAEKCAKDGLRYYEGTTDWRVSLSPNESSSPTAAGGNGGAERKA